ncbi:MAG: DUF4956 domain-containing protein [Bermanella sp.]|nr:DUF4956 domain-containing protein [Bermanella sp.]|tara:strand:+ start:3332 stop:3946 length:615 start_codon:yes stop_codon:yes gene_type:complete
MNFQQDFIIGLLINMAAIVTLVGACYYRFSENRAHSSAFVLFGMGVFMITALLHKTDISMGFAFGLFAVFSMLRYRTESISVKEMTYLFLVIAISLLNAVSGLSPYELITIDAFVIALAYLLETNLFMVKLHERVIEYEKIENIRPQNLQRLKDDIRDRTGWEVVRIDILHIDFLKDCARIKVRFKPNLNGCEETVTLDAENLS